MEALSPHSDLHTKIRQSIFGKEVPNPHCNGCRRELGVRTNENVVVRSAQFLSHLGLRHQVLLAVHGLRGRPLLFCVAPVV